MMKIHEAARLILQGAGQPMHARDIHREIVARKLYTFGAKNPVSMVSQSLRKKSAEASGAGATDAIFKRTAPGIYRLLDCDR